MLRKFKILDRKRNHRISHNLTESANGSKKYFQFLNAVCPFLKVKNILITFI